MQAPEKREDKFEEVDGQDTSKKDLEAATSDVKCGNDIRSIFTIIAVLLGGSQQMLQLGGKTADGHGTTQLLPSP